MQLNIIAMSRCLQEPKSGPDLPDESVVTEKILAIIEERLGPDRYKTFMQFVKATKLKAWYSDFINGIATNVSAAAVHWIAPLEHLLANLPVSSNGRAAVHQHSYSTVQKAYTLS